MKTLSDSHPKIGLSQSSFILQSCPLSHRRAVVLEEESIEKNDNIHSISTAIRLGDRWSRNWSLIQYKHISIQYTAFTTALQPSQIAARAWHS
jgi:hypothetical protein